jgi:hypothetical protein
VTQFNLALYGPYSGLNLGGAGLLPRGAGGPDSQPLPIRIGPPLASLPLPLQAPEPADALLAAAACGGLASLARRRRRATRV